MMDNHCTLLRAGLTVAAPSTQQKSMRTYNMSDIKLVDEPGVHVPLCHSIYPSTIVTEAIAARVWTTSNSQVFFPISFVHITIGAKQWSLPVPHATLALPLSKKYPGEVIQQMTRWLYDIHTAVHWPVKNKSEEWPAGALNVQHSL